MKVPIQGAIDCDIHPSVPAEAAAAVSDEYWRDQFINRHIDRYPFTSTSYPPNSPLSAGPTGGRNGLPGSDFDVLRRQALDAFGTRFAICNVLHGAIALFNEDMAVALCAAVNDWTVARTARPRSAPARFDPAADCKIPNLR